VLYLISVGLSVTMGLMGFVNLAHGVFAMAGGYGDQHLADPTAEVAGGRR
jgi:branched-subunit amino acid ABC-type transport system permease component